MQKYLIQCKKTNYYYYGTSAALVEEISQAAMFTSQEAAERAVERVLQEVKERATALRSLYTVKSKHRQGQAFFIDPDNFEPVVIKA